MNTLKILVVTVLSFFYLGNEIIYPMHTYKKYTHQKVNPAKIACNQIEYLLAENKTFEEIFAYFLKNYQLRDPYNNDLLNILTRSAFVAKNFQGRKAIIEFVIFVIQTAYHNNMSEIIEAAFAPNLAHEDFVVIAIYRGLHEIVLNALFVYQRHYGAEEFKAYLMRKVGHQYINDGKGLLYWASNPPCIFGYKCFSHKDQRMNQELTLKAVSDYINFYFSSANNYVGQCSCSCCVRH